MPLPSRRRLPPESKWKEKRPPPPAVVNPYNHRRALVSSVAVSESVVPTVRIAKVPAIVLADTASPNASNHAADLNNVSNWASSLADDPQLYGNALTTEKLRTQTGNQPGYEKMGHFASSMVSFSFYSSVFYSID
jgi:hypothetical protein